ncbi:hypothetical protein, conserved in T. vivax [Trypanosoma vivax Y486]|uniref:Uncharacterized protein n=1 Tax=Trypanosoma vivax (strain Y486) TaxID=1055687 RepID=F9WMQ2_TRYVY|nr:hypothetical protein, conserved in T. vivax [Trypanosoma vivax Y486]|eukprot:CCD18812.1 hypothetical protein, conserved in T. vivax [Trypanosoma vivax Y486]
MPAASNQAPPPFTSQLHNLAAQSSPPPSACELLARRSHPFLARIPPPPAPLPLEARSGQTAATPLSPPFLLLPEFGFNRACPHGGSHRPSALSKLHGSWSNFLPLQTLLWPLSSTGAFRRAAAQPRKEKHGVPSPPHSFRPCPQRLSATSRFPCSPSSLLLASASCGVPQAMSTNARRIRSIHASAPGRLPSLRGGAPCPSVQCITLFVFFLSTRQSSVVSACARLPRSSAKLSKTSRVPHPTSVASVRVASFVVHRTLPCCAASIPLSSVLSMSVFSPSLGVRRLMLHASRLHRRLAPLLPAALRAP